MICKHAENGHGPEAINIRAVLQTSRRSRDFHKWAARAGYEPRRKGCLLSLYRWHAFQAFSRPGYLLAYHWLRSQGQVSVSANKRCRVSELLGRDRRRLGEGDYPVRRHYGQEQE